MYGNNIYVNNIYVNNIYVNNKIILFFKNEYYKK